MNKTPIEGADLKVRSTSLKTMGDIHALISEAGATENEVAALHDILTGQSTVALACQNHGIVEGEEPIANTVNRFRNRAATILMDALKVITAPVVNHFNAEAQALADAEAQTTLAEKLAEWEKTGRHGRKPGESNRPKSEIAIEKAHAEARRESRDSLGIAAQGRINPELQEKFVDKFRSFYTKSLTKLARKYEDIGDEAKIEKMVNKGVKELAVEKSAQKPKAVKSKKTEVENVPSTETTPEPVA
jgi:hypothetical protein